MNDYNKPLVSICCITYNHENYIKNTIEGFLMQKTLFSFEIIIHDDASTDNTAKLIKKYKNKYPKLIIPIYQKENQWSKGINPSPVYVWPKAKGKYIALCEGDDYWTDPYKLQRQVEFLKKNSDYVAIAENGLVKNSITNTEYLFNTDKEHDVTVEELVIKRRFPTAGVMFKRSMVSNYLKEVTVYYDTMLWCYLASKGKFRYSPNVSSVYNRGIQGVVESTEKLTWAQTVERWNRELIRLFSPQFFNKKIATNVIWNHYWGVYTMCFNITHFSKAHIALFKCYKYDFSKTIIKQHIFFKEKLKFFIKKNLIRIVRKIKKTIKKLFRKKYNHPTFYKKATHLGITTTKRKSLLIVSLTSYPVRIKTVHFTLHTLLNQSLKPDKLILWLAEEQFPGKEKDLPRKIRKLKKFGLTIHWYHDIKSYKKLIPSLKTFPDDIIVTADDDVYYPNNWLELLYKSYLKDKNIIHCHRAHRIIFDKTGNLLLYEDWDKITLNHTSSYQIFITGIGGVLYPPKALHPNVFREDLFTKLSPTTDDVWFWAMAVLNKTKMKVIINNISKTYPIDGTQEIGLWKSVNSVGGNDVNIKSILSYYKNLTKILLSDLNRVE